MGTHSIDQVAPEIKSAENGMVKVERRTISGSIFHGVGSIVNVGMTGYDIKQESETDFNKKTNTLEKTSDIVVDITKNGEKFFVDNAIFDVGIALAPETFGASVFLAVGSAVINDYAVDHIAAGAKSLVRKTEKVEKKAENSVVRTVNKVAHLFGF